jgi:RNA polymerase sigma-70 factor (ECF subfamily)
MFIVERLSAKSVTNKLTSRTTLSLSASWHLPKAERMDPTTDLVRRSAEGDAAAFDCLVRVHMNMVLGLAYSYVGNFHTAEDLAQEAFVQAFQSIAHLRDGSKFKVWLLRIARNKCIDHIRQNPQWISLDENQELQREVSLRVIHAPHPVETDPMEMDVDNLQQVLFSLRQDYREIFIMKHIDNLSYKEIAELLDMTVSAVGEKLYRVRALMRERLEELRDGSEA